MSSVASGLMSVFFTTAMIVFAFRWRSRREALQLKDAGDVVTVAASLRGGPPFPRRWNFNGGHLTVGPDVVHWRRHLRNEVVVTIDRSSISKIGERSVRRFEYLWLAPNLRILQLDHAGTSFELALLPDSAMQIERRIANT